MIHVDSFLDRVPHAGYRCFDFVREVWLASFGEDVGDQLAGLDGSPRDRKLIPSELRLFRRLDAPVDPCFVVFQRHRTVPHIGIWYRGSVLHLAASGAQYTLLHFVSRPYSKVSYYL